jgi:hypothetical protein
VWAVGIENLLMKGHLGRFLGSTWDRMLNFSANAGFRIFWNLTKFQLFYIYNFFFHSFQGGTKRKKPQKPMYSFGNFSAFLLWFPLGNYEKKSCPKELKFCEVSENLKSSICWKFQLSISCGTQKSAKMPQTGSKMIWSFWRCNIWCQIL